MTLEERVAELERKMVALWEMMEHSAALMVCMTVDTQGGPKTDRQRTAYEKAKGVLRDMEED